jgi:hypothetical protein
MIGFVIMIASLVFGLAVWLLGIRRYLSRRGVPVITGANWGLSAWSDWQQLRQHLGARRHATASTLSTAFILSQIGFVVGLTLMLLGF